MNYFIYNLKSKIKLMPILCAILLIFMGSFYIISNTTKSQKINLELLFLEKNPQNNMLLSLINGTTSTKNNINLSTSYNEILSKDKLERGVIDILITVPDNFYESILNSENKKAKVEFSPTISNIEKGIFTTLSNSSMELLSFAQAHIYVSDSILDGEEIHRNSELNKYFLNSSLNREDNFKEEKSQIDNKLIICYITMLILSIVFVNTKSKNYTNVYAYFKVKGEKIIYLMIADIIINTAILLTIIFTSLIVFNITLNSIDIFWDINFIFKILILTIFISSLIEFVTVFFKEGAILFLLLLSIVSILASGLLLPRLAIFTAMKFSPINLILNNDLFSYAVLCIYSIIMLISSNLEIDRSI